MIAEAAANKQKWTMLFLMISLGIAVGIAGTMAFYRKTTSDTARGTPWVGIDVQEVDSAIAKVLDLHPEKGLLVSKILPNSPADEADLQRGDVIMRFDRRQVEDFETMQRVLSKLSVGETVRADIIRDGSRRKVYITIAARPDVSAVLASSVSDTESASAGYWGMVVSPLTSQDISAGNLSGVKFAVIVAEVYLGGLAATAGIQPGDLIVGLNGKKLEDMESFYEKLAKGDSVILDVYRDGEQRYVPVEAGGAVLPLARIAESSDSSGYEGKPPIIPPMGSASFSTVAGAFPQNSSNWSSECICTACGTRVFHPAGIPCADLKCPTCGQRMTSANSGALPTAGLTTMAPSNRASATTTGGQPETIPPMGQTTGGQPETIPPMGQTTGGQPETIPPAGGIAGTFSAGTGQIASTILTSQCMCPYCGIMVFHPLGVPCSSLSCPSCGSRLIKVNPGQPVGGQPETIPPMGQTTGGQPEAIPPMGQRTGGQPETIPPMGQTTGGQPETILPSNLPGTSGQGAAAQARSQTSPGTVPNANAGIVYPRSNLGQGWALSPANPGLGQAQQGTQVLSIAGTTTQAGQTGSGRPSNAGPTGGQGAAAQARTQTSPGTVPYAGAGIIYPRSNLGQGGTSAPANPGLGQMQQGTQVLSVAGTTTQAGQSGSSRPSNAGPTGYCICPKCGMTLEHTAGIPCTQIQCPRCGTMMVKALNNTLVAGIRPTTNVPAYDNSQNTSRPLYTTPNLTGKNRSAPSVGTADTLAVAIAGSSLTSTVADQFETAPNFVLVDLSTGAAQVVPNPNANDPLDIGRQSAQFIADRGAEAVVAASFGQDALTQLLQLRVQPLTDAFASVKDAVAAYIYNAIKDAAQRQDHNVLKDSARSGTATESTKSEEEGNQYGLLKKDWKKDKKTEGSL